MCKTILNDLIYFSLVVNSVKKVKEDMKTSGDFFNTQKQQLLVDGNLFGSDKLSPDYDDRIKKLSENFEKILKESKQSFVVDWQIP